MKFASKSEMRRVTAQSPMHMAQHIEDLTKEGDALAEALAMVLAADGLTDNTERMAIHERARALLRARLPEVLP